MGCDRISSPEAVRFSPRFEIHLGDTAVIDGLSPENHAGTGLALSQDMTTTTGCQMHPTASTRPLQKTRPLLAAVGATAAALLYLCCPAMAQAQASDSIPVAVKGHLPRLALVYDAADTSSAGSTPGLNPPKNDTQPHQAVPQAAGGEFGYKSPGMALSLSLLSTLVPMVVGTIMVSQAHDVHTHLGYTSLAYAGVAGLALGLSFGPSIGYAYSGEHFRGWGMGLLRLVGVGVGSVAIVFGAISGSGAFCSDSCNKSGDGGGWVLLGAVSLIAVVVSAVYDIATAPRAARRANEQHGLTNLSLVPMAIPGRSSTSPGLALVGQF
jgi:hypothetical protein